MPKSYSIIITLAALIFETSAFARDRNPNLDSEPWAFKPLSDAQPPAIGGNSWGRTNIDKFILAAQKAYGVIPNAEADRRTLIRRVYYDLIGLPPSPEEVESFIADPDPQAYEKLVETLLANPHYGERWGRHWLDIARYGDSNGYRYDDDQPNAYHYRDFVIRAFNDDMPYDQFIKWQLAGNEIAPDNLDAITANGFAAIGPLERFEGSPDGKKLVRYNELNDIVATTGSSMLALTMGCCRCHDHKSDPIPTKDYYQLAGVFNSGKRTILNVERPLTDEQMRDKSQWEAWKAELDREIDAWSGKHHIEYATKFEIVRAEYESLIAEAKANYLEVEEFGGEKNWPDMQRQLYKGRHGVKYLGEERLARYKRVRNDYNRLNRDLESFNPLAVKEISSEASEDAKDEFQALRDKRAKLFRHGYTRHNTVLTYQDYSDKVVKTHVLKRGAVTALGDEVELKFLTALTAPDYEPEIPEKRDLQSTYQRTALANWMTNTDKGAGRLLARVMVNRLWHYHFGQGLVRTPNDFGKEGDTPALPDLLDWMSQTFIDSGWKIKDMHRLIMTSAVYRQSSQYDSARSALEPENRTWWRRVPIRLDSEIIRDSVLAISDKLNTQFYGAGVFLPIPKNAIITRAGNPYPTGIEDDHFVHRRSVYAYIKRTVPVPLIQMFDGANASESCGNRIQTTVPTQALLLLNNDLIRARSEDFARRVIKEEPESPQAQAIRAFELALSRPPSQAELNDVTDFYNKQIELRHGDQHGAIADLCQSIFNLNEFIYVN